MPFPTPPPDLSGGFMTLIYSDNTDSHRIRIHVPPFNAAITGAGNDRTYSPVPAATEHTLAATFTGFSSVWSNFFNNAWTIQPLNLFQMQSGVPVELFPAPTFAAVTGAGASATTGIARAIEVLFAGKTTFGHAMRITLIGAGGYSADVPTSVTGNAAGTPEQKMIAYLAGVNTAIVGHDGFPWASNPARRLLPINRRLRRHYGFA